MGTILYRLNRKSLIIIFFLLEKIQNIHHLPRLTLCVPFIAGGGRGAEIALIFKYFVASLICCEVCVFVLIKTKNILNLSTTQFCNVYNYYKGYILTQIYSIYGY